MKAEREAPQVAPAPLLLSIKDATSRLGIGQTKLYSLIAAGQIKRVKIGDRSLIPDSEIQRYIAELVATE